MSKDSTPAASSSDLDEDGSFLEGVPGHYATLSLGLTALGAAIAAYVPALSLVAMIDLPLNFLAFLVCAFIGLGTREKISKLPAKKHTFLSPQVPRSCHFHLHVNAKWTGK